MELKGKWALILGASGVVGLATAKKLASKGMNLCLIYRERKANEVDFLNALKNLSDVEIIALNKDALNKDVRTSVLKSLRDRKIQFDLLLHAIAKGTLKPLIGINRATAKDYEITQYSMAFSLVDWVNDLLEDNLFSKSASVVGLDSQGSSISLPNYGVVGSTKSSLVKLIQDMAVELAPHGIRCNAIRAGVMVSNALKMIPGSDKLIEQSSNNNPSGRITLGEDVANGVYLLCLPESIWITGTIINVDGGEGLVNL